MIANVGGFWVPVIAMGLAVWSWIYQQSGSMSWGAISAIGFIVINLLGLGAIYGTFSKRMDNFETNLPMMIENSILKLETRLRDTYQTKEDCYDRKANGHHA